MPILHVPHVSEELYARFKERAAEERCSLSAEVIVLLEWAVAEANRHPEDRLASIRRRRSFTPAEVGAPSTTELLREDRGR